MRCLLSPLLCRFTGDSKRIGVSTGRLASVLDTAIARLGTNMPVHPYLDPKKFPRQAQIMIHALASIVSIHPKQIPMSACSQQPRHSRWKPVAPEPEDPIAIDRFGGDDQPAHQHACPVTTGGQEAIIEELSSHRLT